MKWFKDLINRSKKETQQPYMPLKENKFRLQIKQNWSKCMNSLQKKMSCGSAQIARILKTRTHWGNKQLWGNRERGRNQPGRQQPKNKN